MTITMNSAEAFCAQCGPELGVALRSELEALRQYSNDRVGQAAQRDSLTGDVFPSSKTSLPGGVAQNRGLRSCKLIFSFVKISAKNRSNSQGSKEASAHAKSFDWHASGFSAKQIPRLVVGVERTEDLVEPFPIQIVQVGKIAAREHCGAFRHIHQAIGMLVRQRPDQGGIHETEDCGAGADPHG